MELREPPRTPQTRPADGTMRLLLIVNLVAVIALGALVLAGRGNPAASGADPEHVREVASKLKAAGALDQAAALYERHLELTTAPAEERASVAYSVGTTYLEQGEHTKALRWFYEAEALKPPGLAEELPKKIVHVLEAMGRVHAARAVLERQTDLDAPATQRPASDPVVARIGKDAVHRSDVLRALDDLPPYLKQQFAGPEKQMEFLARWWPEWQLGLSFTYCPKGFQMGA